MASRDPPAVGQDWPRHLQYHSDATPNKLLARILHADRELHAATSSIIDKNKAHMGSRIMYWHRQACAHRVGQHLRKKFLDHLEKQAVFSEKKQAEKQREQARAKWEAEEAAKDARIRRLLVQWQELREKERKEAEMREAQRVAEEKEKRDREMRDRISAVDRLRAETTVARPLKMRRNAHGQAIHMARV